MVMSYGVVLHAELWSCLTCWVIVMRYGVVLAVELLCWAIVLFWLLSYGVEPLELRCWLALSYGVDLDVELRCWLALSYSVDYMGRRSLQLCMSMSSPDDFRVHTTSSWSSSSSFWAVQLKMLLGNIHKRIRSITDIQRYVHTRML